MLAKFLHVRGLACLAWRFLPLLALLVIFGVVQRCLFLTWRYLALLAFAGVAWRSCTLPFANALSVLLPARWVDGRVTESAWTFMSRAGRSWLSGGERGPERGVTGWRVGKWVGRLVVAFFHLFVRSCFFWFVG